MEMLCSRSHVTICQTISSCYPNLINFLYCSVLSYRPAPCQLSPGLWRTDLEPMAAMKEQDGGWWWLICQDLAFLLSLCGCCLAAGWMKNWLASTGQQPSHTGHHTPAKHPQAILNCGNIEREKQTQHALVTYLIVMAWIRYLTPHLTFR